MGTTTGTIGGAVVDITGGAVPNVAVAISGDALMVPLTSVTGEDGRYRVPLIPSGTYSVVFTRPGFRQVEIEDVIVGIGVTVTVNALLGPATIEHATQVRAESRLLDRHAIGSTTSFTASQLASLPNSATVFAILSATPAVQVSRFEVGGDSGDAAAPYAAYGTAGANSPMVEGINVSAMFPIGFTLDYGAFDEVTVYKSAHGAEWSLPGVHMQMIGRSGSNRYRGTFSTDYEPRSWQAFNVDRDQIQRGASGGLTREANRIWRYHDLRSEVGGFIARDRLWWHGAVRQQQTTRRQVNLPIAPLGARQANLSGKVNARLAANQTVIAYAHAGWNHRPIRLDPFGAGGLTAASAINQSENDTVEQRARGLVWKAEWNAIVGEVLFFELRAGRFDAHRPEHPNGSGARYEDIVTSEVRGGNRDWQQSNLRRQLSGSATFVDNGRFGNHEIRLGGESIRTIVDEIWRRSYPDDVLHVLAGGVPDSVYLFETPSGASSGLQITSAYASDAWRIHDRLTVNLGLRFDRFRVFLPRQSHPAGRFNPAEQIFPAVDTLIAWNETVPRLGAIVDVSGDGRTVAKIALGRYAIAPGTAVGANANPNQPVWWKLYDWSDANGNLVWDPGENLDSPLDSRGGVGLETVDPALELTSLTEAGAWLERELPARVRLKTGIVWRRERNHFTRQNNRTPADAFSDAVLVPDPGADGRAGTGDDGPAIRAHQLEQEFLAPIRQEFRVQNVPGADTRFWTWDVTADRRSRGRWPLLSVGASVTWHGEHAAIFAGQRVRQNPFPITPNDLINAGRHGRYDFTMWTIKIHGTYDGPWGLRITPHLRHQSGQPFGRTVVGHLNYGNVRLLAEPIGTRRMDHITLVDVRLEKGWRLSGRRVAALVDGFNLFNANPEQSTSWASGTFLRPLDIVPPRVVRVGVRLDW